MRMVCSTKNQENFLNFAKDLCRQHSIKLVITNGSFVNCYGRSSGYFDHESKIIRVAGQNPFLWDVLVHEICHLIQFADLKSPFCKTSGDIYFETYSAYISGTSFDEDTLARTFDYVIRCEMDCDRRAVKLIKSFGLDQDGTIDLTIYIKLSNAYHYSYYFAWQKQSTNYGFRLFDNKALLNDCPDHFKVRPNKYLPRKIARHFGLTTT